MTQTSRATWSYLSWAMALVMGFGGMYAARQKQVYDAEKAVRLAAAEHQLAVAERAQAKTELELASAERQLVNDRHRELKALFESTSQAIIVVTHDHKIAKYSRGAEEMFGWTYDEVIGKDADFLMPAGMVAQHRTGFNAAVAKQAADATDGIPDFNPGDNEKASTVVIQCAAKHKNGNDVLVIISVRMFMAGGKPHAFAAFDLADSVKYVDARPGVN